MRSGFVAVAGRPNVGKSTLVNALCGRKVAIVSDKPQTTRLRIFGIANGDDYQLVLADLPGFQKPLDTLTERMQQTVDSSFEDVEGVCHRSPLAAEQTADAAGSAGSGRQGTEDVVVQRAVGDSRVLAQQVLGFRAAVEGERGIEHCALHPRRELGLRLGNRRVGQRAVAGRPAENAVDEQRRVRILDLPHATGVAVVERGKT